MEQSSFFTIIAAEGSIVGKGSGCIRSVFKRIEGVACINVSVADVCVTGIDSNEESRIESSEVAGVSVVEVCGIGKLESKSFKV